MWCLNSQDLQSGKVAKETTMQAYKNWLAKIKVGDEWMIDDIEI